MADGESPKTPLKRKFHNSNLSPFRENLLHNVTYPNKKSLFEQRYLPRNSIENGRDICKSFFSKRERAFCFRNDRDDLKENAGSDLYLPYHVNNSNYTILRTPDKEIENNIILRDKYNFNLELLENEIIGPKNNQIQKTLISPRKKTPVQKILDFSNNTHSLNSSLFERSPGIALSPASRGALLSPKKKYNLPEVNSYKILDAPGIVDDFYLKLIDWSNDNMIAVALDRKLYMYNYNNERVREIYDYTINREAVTSVAWSRTENGKILFGTSRGRILYFDVVKGKSIIERNAHRDRVGVLDWNDNVYTNGSKDRQIFNFDILEKPTRPPVFSFTKHSHEICGLEWSPGGHTLASGGNDNKLILWNRHHPKPMMEFRSHGAAVRALSWSPHDHGVLASGGGSADRCIKIWNTLTCNELKSVTTRSQICNLAWSKHTKQFLSTHGYNDNSISLWNYPSLETIIKLRGHNSRVLQMALSPDDESIVTAAADETVRFWKVFPHEHSSKKASSLFKALPTIR